MDALIIGISGSLSAVGLVALGRWALVSLTAYLTFRPFHGIWAPFRQGDTIIVLSARLQGNTQKVSFSETQAAWRIQKLLTSSISHRTVPVYTADDPTIPLDKANVISIGDEQYNDVTRRILHAGRGNFSYSYTADNDVVLDHRVYATDFQDGKLIRDYGLVVKSRNPFAPKRRALVFAGNHGPGTLASVIALTSASKASEIVGQVRENNFYAVIESSFDESPHWVPTDIRVCLCNFLVESGPNVQPLPLSREKQLESLLHDIGATDACLEHVRGVSKLALTIAQSLEGRGVELDLEAVWFGAMLHDIGRTVRNDIRHAIAGVELVQANAEELVTRFGLRQQTMAKILESVRCHIVGGIPVDWIRDGNLDLPVRDFLPTCIEAMLVGLCDQLVHSWESRDDVLAEAPQKAGEVFERLYYQCRYIILTLCERDNPSHPAPLACPPERYGS